MESDYRESLVMRRLSPGRLPRFRKGKMRVVLIDGDDVVLDNSLSLNNMLNETPIVKTSTEVSPS